MADAMDIDVPARGDVEMRDARPEKKKRPPSALIIGRPREQLKRDQIVTDLGKRDISAANAALVKFSKGIVSPEGTHTEAELFDEGRAVVAKYSILSPADRAQLAREWKVKYPGATLPSELYKRAKAITVQHKGSVVSDLQSEYGKFQSEKKAPATEEEEAAQEAERQQKRIDARVARAEKAERKAAKAARRLAKRQAADDKKLDAARKRLDKDEKRAQKAAAKAAERKPLAGQV
jgi:hypothetical protein